MERISRAAVTALCTVGLLAVVVAARGPSAQSTGAKMAFINSELILQQHPARAAAEAQFKQANDAWDARKGHMQDTLDAMNAAFVHDLPTLSAAVQATRKKAIDDKTAAYSLEEQTTQDSLTALQDNLIGPMVALLRTVLDSVRQDQGYSVILDLVDRAGVITSYDKNLDITPAIAARYRQLAVASAATSPAGRAAAPAPAPGATTGRSSGARPTPAPR